MDHYAARTLRQELHPLPEWLRATCRVHSGKPASIKASRIFERADFIRAHEAAVAFDIRCEDRDEASAH
jgi:hypothetical protein